MAKGRILLGVVAAPHGVRGLVRIRSFTEDPMAIATYGALSDETGQKRYRVEKFLAQAELMKPRERREQTKKPLPRAKAQERMKAAAAAEGGKEAAAS